jgi:hypothetical protein
MPGSDPTMLAARIASGYDIIVMSCAVSPSEGAPSVVFMAEPFATGFVDVNVSP